MQEKATAIPPNNYILTIAGFDPSSGAGLTSDIKTFEAHGLYGLSVCTAITVQNDVAFKNCVWVEETTIHSQIETLFERFKISTVKIGIIKSWRILLNVQKLLKELNPEIVIILDPVLKASAGFKFHSAEETKLFEEVLEYCDFITPNYEEIANLFPKKTIEETIDFIGEKTTIYLKGGHRQDKKGWDEVYYKKIAKLNIPPITNVIYEKHGSGCVLSSALAANLHKKMTIEEASKYAKAYTEQFLNSNQTLLGNHKYQ